ncbi:MAG: 2-oxoglutarate and iron-dependent oxygenase domain-containing protein [Ancalomicrobiaceae bacterium]|nr:2-oxoglutarate and iron-dependent oxygenase domain-containing protein [Ancalomicrobiaceae bacterium]
MSETIPIIDLSGGRFSDAAETARIGQEIGAACRTIGFFYCVNHGIDLGLRDEIFRQSAAFFALPIVDKAALSIARVGDNRGYVGLKAEALDPTKGGDGKEAFNIGYDPGFDGGEAGSANAWPALPGFRLAAERYFAACLTLGRGLHRAIATDLGLKADFFADKFTRPMATMRLLHYPSVDHANGDLGAGEHTDYGNLTLLATDEVGGLEVRRRDGEWLRAPVIPGAYVVNIGDCLMRWTNDIYRSTPHRVVSPSGRERYSIAVFLDPNQEAEVAALPGTVAPGAVPNYPPTTALAHLTERLNATYAFRRQA